MYYLVYCFFYLLSLLPWFIIYLLSDAIFFIVYYLAGYRKEVMMNNLLIAFPEKTDEERKTIAKESMSQLIDTLLETIKLLSISKKELNKRFVGNYEVLNDLFESGQNVQLHGGHFYNWEFVNLAFCINSAYPFMGVYLPLTNKVFNKLMYQLRERFGSGLISAFNFNREFFKYSKGRYALALCGDQNAGDLSNCYWLPFFGKMAPFFTGLERMAVAKNTAIIMVTTYRIKRGYYQCELSTFTKEPKLLPKGAITIAFRNFLEEQIRLRPANYLWTHRRWKHAFDAEKYSGMVIENTINK